MQNKKTTIAHTIKLSTNSPFHCEYCEERIGADQIDRAINHLIQQHTGELLHVGSEYGGSDDRGLSVHFTVAMVGLSVAPPKSAPSSNRFSLRMQPTPGEDGSER